MNDFLFEQWSEFEAGEAIEPAVGSIDVVAACPTSSGLGKLIDSKSGEGGPEVVDGEGFEEVFLWFGGGGE